jgi:RES domain-containing protein
MLPLTGGGAPDYLFTSGRANRWNPAGVDCIYFSEDERTARAEYGRRLGRAAGALQPLGIFFAEVELAKILDLEDQPTRNALNLKARDLTVRWQTAQKPTRSQLLGLAVSQQQAIAAIRFPSDAARAAGFLGFNLAIFRGCVRRPDFVRILGPTKKALQKWP